LLTHLSKTYTNDTLTEILTHCDTSENKDSALHLACRQGNLEILEMMMEKVKDPKGIAKEKKNGEGETMMDVAEQEGHDEVVDYLRDMVGEQGVSST